MTVPSTFEQLWDEPSALPAQANAGQVVVPRSGAGSASEIESREGVESLVVRRNFVVDAPMPQLLELFVDGVLLAPNPQFTPKLRTAWTPWTPWKQSDLTGVPAGLVDLAADNRVLAGLGRWDKLERLWAHGPVNGEVLAALPELRWLKASPRGGVGVALRGMERLERLDLELESATVARLSLLGPKPELRRASLWWNGVCSLEGIERWQQLDQLLLYCVGARSLAPLADTPVRELEIASDRRTPFEDIETLGGMPHLELLTFRHEAALESLGVFGDSSPIREILLGGTELGPHALDGLFDAPNLRRLVCSEPSAVVDRLVAARPDVEITIVADASPTPTVSFDGVGLFDNGSEGWSIFQNLAGYVGVETNHDVERAVKQRLEKADLVGIKFDTEAGHFAAYAATREEIELVARAVNELAASHG